MYRIFRRLFYDKRENSIYHGEGWRVVSQKASGNVKSHVYELYLFLQNKETIACLAISAKM